MEPNLATLRTLFSYLRPLRSPPISRHIARILLAVHLLFLLYTTLLIFQPNNVSPNLMPLRSIVADWRAGGRPFVVNFLGNLGVFMPVGFLLPAIRSPRLRLWAVLTCCFVLSGGIEVAQYLLGSRVGDVDDVLLNVVGGALGYALWRLYADCSSVR